MTSESDDLFFDLLVRGYVDDNPRFLRRDWLATELDEKLAESGRRFLLLTAEPGAGKSTFMAQLAHDHPDWQRYFIRRDQRAVLADVSDRSLLLRIGYQFAARHPELFTPEALRLSVVQRVGEVANQGEVIGAEVKRLTASPFYQKVLEIEQQVRSNAGRVVGLRVEELVVESRLLPVEDLLDLALIHPARALARTEPGKQIVILIDALDEIRYHPTTENILAWLINCPDLSENVRFVLSSRPPDEALNLFRRKQAERLAEIEIAEGDTNVKQDVQTFVTKLVGEPTLAQALVATPGGAAAFTTKATDRAHGNLGYLDALARGIDQALAHKDAQTLEALLGLKELPTDLEGLYAFFLRQIKASVARERVELKDPETGETYDKPVWPAVYDPMLGVLAVAMEPLDVDLIARLGGIRAERAWVLQAFDRLLQFLDVINGRYRFYHATVAEFLTADKTRDNTDLDTAALYQDPQQRHRQITDYYWRHSKNWAECDAYGLANLVAHLVAAERTECLHQLLWTEDTHSRNAWFAAKEDRSDSHGYIEDLRVAFRVAVSELLGPSRDRRSRALLELIRYTLVASSINGIAAALPTSLLGEMATRSLWPTEVAFAFARRVPRPDHRIASLAAILPHLDSAPRRRCYAEAISTIGALRSISGNSDTFYTLRAEAVAQLADAAHKAGDHDLLVNLWKDCGSWAVETQLVDALSRTLKLVPDCYAEKLHSAAQHLYDAAKEVVGRWKLLDALAPDRRCAELKTWVDFMKAPTADIGAAISVLAALSKALDRNDRDALVVHFLTRIYGANNSEELRARWLADLLPLMTPHELKRALAIILKFIANGEADVDTFGGLLETVLAVPNVDIAAVAETVRGIKSKWTRALLSCQLFAHEDSEQVERLAAELDAYMGLQRDEGKWAWEELTIEYCRAAPWLSDVRKDDLFATVTTITDDMSKLRALTNLGPWLRVENLGALLREALESLRRVANDDAADELFRRIGPRLSNELIQFAVADLRNLRDDEARTCGLAALVDNLPDRDRANVVCWWLEKQKGADEACQVRDLTVIAPYLNRDTLRAEALSLAMQLREATDRIRCVCAISRLSPRDNLQEGERQWVLAEIESVADERAKVGACVDALNSLPSLRGSEFATRTFDLISQVGYLTNRAKLVARLRADWYGTETETLQRQVLRDLRTEGKDTVRRDALIEMAPALTPTALRDALAFITESWTSEDMRWEAWPQVACRAAELGDPQNAYREVMAQPSSRIKGHGLEAIAPYLDAARIQEGLQQYLAIENPYMRDRALDALCRRAASIGMVEEVAPCAATIGEPSVQAGTLAVMAAAARGDRRAQLLEGAIAVLTKVNAQGRGAAVTEIASAIAVCDEIDRADALSRCIALLGAGTRAQCIPQIYQLSPALSAVGGPQSLLGVLASIDDVRRWWP